MIKCVEDLDFNSKCKPYRKRYRSFDSDLEKAKTLLIKHFDPKSEFVFSPNNLFIDPNLPSMEIYKLDPMPIQSLKKAQCPRVWLIYKDGDIILLEICSHVFNYKEQDAVRSIKKILKLM